MKKILSPLLLGISLAVSTATFAENRTEHFKGLPAPDLATAVKNLSEYNDLLAVQLSGELTPQTLAEVHQLTYTLENALGKINAELANLAETLEEVHIASETAEAQIMASKGREFLQVVDEMKKL